MNKVKRSNLHGIAKAAAFIMSSLLLCAGIALKAPGKTSAITLPVVHESGTLSSDETWTNGSVYVVDSTLTVLNGVTLTIDAGTIVKYAVSNFNNGIDVQNGGTLNVNGISGSPVTFTSYRDDNYGGDSNGDGPSNGSVYDYESAIAPDGGTISVTYADFHYANTDIEGVSSGGILSASDSTFEDSQGAIRHDGGTVSLARNTFNVSYTGGSGAVDLRDLSDVTGVVLAGSDKNTFSGSGAALMIAVNGTVPSGDSWYVSPTSGAILKARGLTVNGTLNVGGNIVIAQNPGGAYWNFGLIDDGVVTLGAGTIFKTESYSEGVQIDTGGTLNVYGTAVSPVVFTSYRDDSTGGDTMGDGPTTASSTDYGRAILVNGGLASIDYANVKYGQGIETDSGDFEMTNSHLGDSQGQGFYMIGGTSKLNNVTINNDSSGLFVTGNAHVFLRNMVFDNISGRAVKACDWNGSCTVDAAYVDWGSSNGPFGSTSTDDLVCGAVTVAPWVHNSTIYGQSGPDLYQVKNCSGYDTPEDGLNDAIAGFQGSVASYETSCAGGLHDACDIADAAYACLTGAVDAAAGTSPFPLPSASGSNGDYNASDVMGFGGNAAAAAATLINSEEKDSYTAMASSFVSDLLGVTGTMTSLSNAYNSCHAHG